MSGNVSRKDFLKLGGTTLAGAALFGVAGCGGGNQQGQGSKGTLQWQAIPTYSTEQNTDQKRVDYLKGAISGWEKKSGWSVKPLVSSSDITAANAKLLQQAQQGRAPDISQVDSYIFPRFFQYAQPLDDYLGNLSLDDWFPFARAHMVSGGKVKGLQFTTDVRVLFYRKDLVPTPPKSWDEVLSTGQKLKGRVKSPFLFPAGRDEGTMTTTLLPYFWSQGGELTDAKGNPTFGQGKNRQAMLNALSFIDRCVKSGITPKKVSQYGLETDLDGDVASGDVAMFQGANFQVPLLQQIMGDKFTSQWEVSIIPSKSGTNFVTSAGGQMWGVFTKDKKKQKAAVDFLKAVFVGNEGMAKWCNVGGYLPVRKSVYDVKTYKGNKYTGTFREYLQKYARNRPGVDSYQNISTALQVAVTQVVSGQKTPEQALATAVQTVS